MISALIRSFKNMFTGGDVLTDPNWSPAAPPTMLPPKRTEIADVEYMGRSAVATFTVTELSDTHGAAMLADLLEELGNSGAQNFVLDLQNVQHMDSRCLGCLVEATNFLSARGGKIALVNPAHTVQYLFTLTRLDRVFPICHDVIAALRAVERTSAA